MCLVVHARGLEVLQDAPHATQFLALLGSLGTRLALGLAFMPWGVMFG